MKTNYDVKHISWQEYDKLVENILIQLKDYNIDVIVPVLRGGSVLGLSIANNLKKPTKYIRIKRSCTNEENSDFGEPKLLVYEKLPKIKNKNILICEDVVDTQKTINFAKKIISKYKPNNIYVCTLYNFSNNTSLISGYYGQQNWIVFPWERKFK